MDKKKQEQKPPWEDKLVSLRAQRRARGEKFHLDHKCNKTVQLNVVEELLEILQLSSDSEAEEESESSSDESCHMLSAHAAAGTTHKKSIRLLATI